MKVGNFDKKHRIAQIYNEVIIGKYYLTEKQDHFVQYYDAFLDVNAKQYSVKI